VGTPAEGNVRAKTGSLAGVVSLTGHLTTGGGRLVVFSLIANGPGATADGQGPATQAIDALVVALAADTS
jgi:D-alanyl-D-alanine carboxypeptidase/D-alanyl-D-alanine-endopeptidase (penicillin-binding protein 4)